ncbi:MAG: 50S ribosomal protein L11 methyltransferase [Roseburia sp.]|nr:50S ribosomal protein L11 methyltransferase [Roseburia sp.]MCM1279396.1 50S ribosomal protein L11 methyltransferase [Robinsoniella sp.]
MKWKKLTIKTITSAEDIIISTLYDIGLEGAQIEDNVPLTAWEKEQMFVDIPPMEKEDDGIAYLNFFVEVPDKQETIGEKEQAESIKAEKSEMKKNGGRKSSEIETEPIKPGLSEAVDNSYTPVSSGKPVDMEQLLKQVEEELNDLRSFMDIGEGAITVSETEDKDWINNWKEYFHQFAIDDLLVIPSWEEVSKEHKGKKLLHIDPGTAFGTGMHETTQLCIRQIKKFVTEDTRLLDVGTGSGILGIVSLLYGGKSVVGTDLDPCAVEAVAENLEANRISKEAFTMLIGNIITEKEVQDQVGYGGYDIVVANILAEVLVPLTPVVVKHLKQGGIYITSGIIAEKEQLVVETVKQAGLTLMEVTRQGEWVSVTARKE